MRYRGRVGSESTGFAQSGLEGIVTMEKLAEFADRPIAQGQGKTAIEAVKAMAEQKWSRL